VAFIPTDVFARYVNFQTASNVSLTATTSPGTPIVQAAVNIPIRLTYVVLIGSVTLYNGGSVSVNEVIQVFSGTNYVNVATVTVGPSTYVQVTVNYVFLTPGTTTIGLAAYGGTLTAQVAEMTLLGIG
jgi:hypothetical protein